MRAKWPRGSQRLPSQLSRPSEHHAPRVNPCPEACKVARVCGTNGNSDVRDRSINGGRGAQESARRLQERSAPTPGYLEDILDRPLKALAKAVVPAYKTTRNAAVQRESQGPCLRQ